MNRKHQKKLSIMLSLILVLGAAVGLILYALKQNINLFFTPTQLLESTIQPRQALRLGGYVKEQSVQYDKDGANIRFIITDRKNEVMVNYQGVLPNLFREGQGVVVTGKLQNNQVLATEVLAKHDEKYMPPIVKTALQEKDK